MGIFRIVQVAGIITVLLASAWLLLRVYLGKASASIDPKTLEGVLSFERESSQRIAEQLHDTAVQSLVVATYMARSASTDADAMDTLTDQLLAAEREVRDVIINASEPDIRTRGLGAGCAHLHKLFDLRDGLQVDWEWRAPSATPIPEVAATLAYRFLNETLTNVVKHAGVPRASVALTALDDVMTIVVTDTGIGFDRAATPAAASWTSGLKTLGKRALLQGAGMSVTTGLGQGTRVTLRVPIDVDIEQTVVLLGPSPTPGRTAGPSAGHGVIPTQRSHVTRRMLAGRH